jgi:uncharacterized protein YjbI with pentapeptide repeats
MANDDHIAKLKEGVNAWNAWRAENPDIHPDLRRAILSGAHLEGANLFRANLEGADLSGATLSGAHLGAPVRCRARGPKGET